MPLQKFVIERDLPGVGQLSADELHTIATKSNSVVRNLSPRLQWVESFITPDKLYCIYLAEDAEVLYEHARGGGFPATAVNPVVGMFDPTTGD